MKKIIFVFLTIFLLFPFNVFAENNKKNMELYSETSDGYKISRFYMIDGETFSTYRSIELPKVISQKAIKSKDPLYTAKKELFLAYLILGLDGRLNELNNDLVYDYSYTPTISAEIKEHFFEQNAKAFNEAYDEFKNLDVNEYKKLYDTSIRDFQDFEDFDPYFNEQLKSSHTDLKVVKDYKKEFKNLEKGSSTPWVLIALFISLIGGAVYLFLKRR